MAPATGGVFSKWTCQVASDLQVRVRPSLETPVRLEDEPLVDDYRRVALLHPDAADAGGTAPLVSGQIVVDAGSREADPAPAEANPPVLPHRRDRLAAEAFVCKGVVEDAHPGAAPELRGGVGHERGDVGVASILPGRRERQEVELRFGAVGGYVNPEEREEGAVVECGLDGYLDALDLLPLGSEPAPGPEEARQRL